MKRIVVLTLSLIVLLSALPAFPVSAAQIVATEEDVILLAGSDFQVGGNSTDKVENILDVLALHGLTKADGAFFVGDYTPSARETNTSTPGIEALIDEQGDNIIFYTEKEGK